MSTREGPGPRGFEKVHRLFECGCQTCRDKSAPASPPSPAAAPATTTVATVNDGRGTLTVTMRPPTGPARADADVDALSNPLCQQIIRVDVDSLYFHQLRLRATQDPSLAKHITVLYTDKDGRQRNLGLLDEVWRWPVGFEQEGWEIEMAITAAQSPLMREHAARIKTSSDVQDALRTALDAAESQVRTLQGELEEMRAALIAHRADLHCWSSRPCPTCRDSAKALGIHGKVPDICARGDTDRAALSPKDGDPT